MRRAAAKQDAKREAAAASKRTAEVAAMAEEAKAAKQAKVIARRAARKVKALERQVAKKAAKESAARKQDATKLQHCWIMADIKNFKANTLKIIEKTKQNLRHQLIVGSLRRHHLRASRRPKQPSADLPADTGDSAASPRVPEPEQSNFEEDVTQDDDWLSDDTKDEIQELEELAKQLDEVVAPTIKAKPEPLELKTQQIEKFKRERKPLDLDSAKKSVVNSTKVATIIIPMKAIPNIIPSKQPPPFRDRSRSMYDVRGCKRHFRGCQQWRNHSGPCEGVLDIGYLCIQPRAQMRVHKPLWCPFVGPR